MGQILRNWRVLSATLFAVVLVVGAYLLARGIESPSLAQASTESALLQAVAARDSDGDGLPDWEESLYGTDPHLTDTKNLGMTDGEAVAKGLIVPKAIADIPATASAPAEADSNGLPPPPAQGTLTAAFTQNFINFFFAARQANGGADLSEADMQNIASQTIQSLSTIAAIAPDYKTAKDLTISGSGTEALTAYAVGVEAVFNKNTSNATTSELNYLKRAIEDGDATGLPHIASIAKAYRDSAVGLSALPVPQELRVAGLALINAMMRMSQIVSDFSRVNDDPLATIIALQQYRSAVKSLGLSFISLGSIYRESGISIPAGTPGSTFIASVEKISASSNAMMPSL